MQFITPSLQSRIFSATSAHIYIRPHILLQPYIAHYTLHIQEIANKNKELVLIPDIAGCMVFTLHHMNWIYNLGSYNQDSDCE